MGVRHSTPVSVFQHSSGGTSTGVRQTMVPAASMRRSSDSDAAVVLGVRTTTSQSFPSELPAMPKASTPSGATHSGAPLVPRAVALTLPSFSCRHRAAPPTMVRAHRSMSAKDVMRSPEAESKSSTESAISRTMTALSSLVPMKRSPSCRWNSSAPFS